MGLETLFELYKDSTKSRLHEIYISLHNCLLLNNFKCIGKSYDSSKNASVAKSSELLPRGWNDDLNTVELYYTRATSNEVYKVLVLAEGTCCLMHLIKPSSNADNAAIAEIELSDYLHDTSLKTVEEVYKNVDDFKKVVSEKLINHVLDANKFCQTSEKNIKEPERPFVGVPVGEESASGQGNPLQDYGRADIDPFYNEPGGLGSSPLGGMIFDPLRHVRPRAPGSFPGLIQPLPRGSVPPGARFDPFGPPGTGLPDPDFERRPNFNDDFYS